MFFKRLLFIVMLFNTQAYAYNSRIKDIVKFEGIRDNMLVGYGLVVGLNGTGDNLNNSNFTQKGLTDFLGKMGVNMKGANIKTKNVAAVTVTATLPAFARQGSRVDINVSAIGDAKSLQGGTLLATPLVGADGEVYVVAQGSVSVAGFQASGKATTINKGVTTNSFISNGGIVEKEIDFDLSSLKQVKLSLKNPDISTAIQIAKMINNRLNSDAATALDPGTVRVNVPEEYLNNTLALLGQIEKIEVRPDTIAKIIIDESSGTIVLGENVKINPIGIAQGNLTITVKDGAKSTSNDPFAFSFASINNVTPATDIIVDEDKDRKLTELNGGASLKEVVEALNSLGVGPRDLITILQNIKAAGALQADIEIR